MPLQGLEILQFANSSKWSIVREAGEDEKTGEDDKSGLGNRGNGRNLGGMQFRQFNFQTRVLTWRLLDIGQTANVHHVRLKPSVLRAGTVG